MSLYKTIRSGERRGTSNKYEISNYNLIFWASLGQCWIRDGRLSEGQFLNGRVRIMTMASRKKWNKGSQFTWKWKQSKVASCVSRRDLQMGKKWNTIFSEFALLKFCISTSIIMYYRSYTDFGFSRITELYYYYLLCYLKYNNIQIFLSSLCLCSIVYDIFLLKELG
jgi:hypothetical protein